MNFANSFLKDIKGNSSINQFGSKIKNMSQSIVPENTKDILASAASSISSAAQSTANMSGSQSTIQRGQSSQKIDPHNPDAKSSSGVFTYSQSPSNNSFQQQSRQETNYYQQQQQQQQQQHQSRPSMSSSTQRIVSREPSSDQTSDYYSRNNQADFSTGSGGLQRDPSSQSRMKQPLSPTHMMESPQSQRNHPPAIDPLELDALKDTNEALKTEVQRLSLFELKSKTLEKEAKNAKELRETNEKLETEVKELNKYRNQCQKLEAEISQLKLLKQADEEKFRSIERQSNTNKEKLEQENQTLINKIKELDKMIGEYEANFAQFKQKEQSLEKRIEYLESELDRLTQGQTFSPSPSSSAVNTANSTSITDSNDQKLDALEQANRILEQELDSLKKQQKAEREKVKERMELLQAKQSEKLKKLEDSNIYYKEQLEKTKRNESHTVEYLQKQCDDLRQRVNELETSEQDGNGQIEKSFNELKQEMKNQSDLLSEERRKFEMERKNFNELNVEYARLTEAIQMENKKHAQEIESYEQRLLNLQAILDKKEAEINELKNSKELEASNYLSKLSLLNDENMSLINQLKSINTSTNAKDDELNKQRKKLSDLVNEYDKLRGQVKSYSSMENDLVDLSTKNTQANEKIHMLETKINEWEKKYNKELESFNTFSQQQQQLIKQLKQQLTAETLKHESLNADFSLLKLEANKLESLKAKCDHLEAELRETRSSKLSRLSEYESTANKFNETNEKYENEIKMLNNQIASLRNDMKIKEQDCKQLEKTIDTERNKALMLVKQLEELNNFNSQLTIQNAEYKRRLVSLDLLTDECNQLRKNLTLMTIESESRKAEVSTLNSQITILESTVKSLRDASEKHNKLELNYDTAAYELRKKHEDYKRLQQLHETVKKEQLDTIELLEEKLRDVEKKTELQSLKHEEIMLELESIRAKRERLMPFCPNCSTQQIAMYQPKQHIPPPPSLPPQTQPQPQQLTNLSQTNTQNPQYSQLQAQPLLSISIPQQSITPANISPSNMSPYQAIQAQAHLSHFQVITLPGKQSVTVECQTSPLNEVASIVKKPDPIQQPQQQQQQPVIKKVEKATVSCQTVLSELSKPVSVKEVNTDPIDFSFMNKKQPPAPVVVKQQPVMRNQSVGVDMFKENPKILEDKGIQSNLEPVKLKYYLYTCKYSYDPFKNSPNDNPEAELPLLTGDYLYILNEEDEYGFFNGELLDGKRGLVPSNFVERANIDHNNLNRCLQTLPKTILTHPKFKECCNVADLGQVMIIAQQMAQKLNIQPPLKQDETTQTTINNVTVATSTTAISTSTVSTMTIAQPAQPVSSVTTALSKQVSSAAGKISTIPTSFEDASDAAIKIGLPYPNNLKVEKFSDKSVIVTWDPPSAPISLSQSIDGENLTGTYDMNEMNILQNYSLYLNHELYTVLNIAEDRVVIIDDVDLSVPNRVSIQAIVNKEISSKPQECTLLFGSNRSFAPSNLSVFSLSQTSAIVSWWPSSSLFSHIISIDSIEHRTLKPGVYRFKLSGLLPDTSHLVIVTAQIPNHTNESSSNYAASVEFRTLASKVLGIPQNLSILKDPNEQDSYNLSWEPTVTIENPISNGIVVGGYSIYLDGIRVHQILNPIASTVSLSSKLLFNGAKLLTVRTLSLDGNSESKDSQPIKLSKSLMGIAQPNTIKANENITESPKKKQEQQSTGLFGQTGSLLQNFSNEINSLKANTKNALNEIKPTMGPGQQLHQPSQSQPIQPPVQSQPVQSQPAQSMTKKISNPMIKNMPLVSDISRKKTTDSKPPQSKSGIDTDADLYENFRSDPAPKQPAKPQKTIQNPYNAPNIINTPQKKVVNETNNIVIKSINDIKPIPNNQQQQLTNTNTINNNNNNNMGQSSNSNKQNQNYRLFIALFDYDPYQMSPNPESCTEELPFKEGQLIKIFGDQDDDGFYYGESNGRAGYIPSNMVQEVPQDEQNIVSQFNTDTSQYGAIESDPRKTMKGGSNSPSSKNKTTKQQQSSSSSKMQQHQQQQQYQQQSKEPVSFQASGGNNPNNQYNKPQPPKNVCVMIALYDYDPQSLSPNVDVDIELPFRTGDIITVIGEMDEDGFFMAELKGKRGLVPSNFLQPLPAQQQEQFLQQQIRK